MSWDTTIFFILNNLAGRYAWLDKIGVFCAQYLIFFLAFFLFALLLSRKEEARQTAILSLLAVFAALAANWLISVFLPSARPFVHHSVKLLLSHRPDSSFPSDHTAISFAIAFSLLFLKKYYLGAVALLAAFLIGLGRVYVGIHWPSDIAGGILTGFLGAFLIFQLKSLFRPLVVKLDDSTRNLLFRQRTIK